MTDKGTWGALETKPWGEAFPERWRVAIIGAGPRAQGMATIWQERDDVEIVGLCDPAKETVTQVAEKLKVPAFTDVLAMLRQNPHIVINATRAPLHYPLSLLALQVLALQVPGLRALIVEKPIADSPAHAGRLVDLAESCNVLLAVCHQTSCTPPVTKALKMVADGAIGDLRSVEITGKGYFAGYELFNLAPHYLNVALLFAGPVTAVQAHASDTDVVHLPYQFGTAFGANIGATLKTESGVEIVLALNQAKKPSTDAMAINLIGSKGALQLYRRWWIHQMDDQGDWQPVAIPPEERTLRGYDYLQRSGGDDWLAEVTLQKLRGERFTHPCSGWLAAKGLEVIWAILESAFQNSSISLNGQVSAFALPAANPDPRLSVLRYREWATRKTWLRV